MGLYGFELNWEFYTYDKIKEKKTWKLNETYFFINLVPISVTDALWEITD